MNGGYISFSPMWKYYQIKGPGSSYAKFFNRTLISTNLWKKMHHLEVGEVKRKEKTKVCSAALSKTYALLSFAIIILFLTKRWEALTSFKPETNAFHTCGSFNGYFRFPLKQNKGGKNSEMYMISDLMFLFPIIWDSDAT